MQCDGKMERIEVAVRYRNGRILQGISHNFLPNKDHLLLFPADNPSDKPTEVPVKEIETLFVVRDFALVVFWKEKRRWSIQVVTLQ